MGQQIDVLDRIVTSPIKSDLAMLDIQEMARRTRRTARGFEYQCVGVIAGRVDLDSQERADALRRSHLAEGLQGRRVEDELLLLLLRPLAARLTKGIFGRADGAKDRPTHQC